MRKKVALVGLALVGSAWLLSVILVPYDSPRKARERVLKQDLFAMRAIVDQYRLDKHQRPQSLNDLVISGYMKKVPTHPVTGRYDTWVVKCSDDPLGPGIEKIESGYGQASNNARSQCD